MTTGKELNERYKVGAVHALYREDGRWYHHLVQFPGALFDAQGFVVFKTEAEYTNCKSLQHGEDLHVPMGIATLPGYTKFTS